MDHSMTRLPVPTGENAVEPEVTSGCPSEPVRVTGEPNAPARSAVACRTPGGVPAAGSLVHLVGTQLATPRPERATARLRAAVPGVRCASRSSCRAGW